MENFLRMGCDNRRIRIHKVPEIGNGTLSLEDQLLFHQTDRMRIIVTKETSQSITLRGHK
jgi:hypothetical protein